MTLEDYDHGMATKWYQSIQFTQTETAKLLKFSATTLSNREAKGVFPVPKKVGARKKYSVIDVMRLMLIEHGTVSIQRLFVGVKTKLHITPSQMKYIPALMVQDLVALHSTKEYKAT